jgi:hypothetical protein
MLRFAILCLCAVIVTGCIKVDVHSKVIDDDTVTTDVSIITNMLVAAQIKDSLKDEPVYVGTRHLDDGRVELYFTEEGFPFEQGDWDCSGLFTTTCEMTVRQVFNMPMEMTLMQSMAEADGKSMSQDMEPTMTFTVELPSNARNRSSNADTNHGTTYQWHLNFRKDNMLQARLKTELP